MKSQTPLDQTIGQPLSKQECSDTPNKCSGTVGSLENLLHASPKLSPQLGTPKNLDEAVARALEDPANAKAILVDFLAQRFTTAQLVHPDHEHAIIDLWQKIKK